jgi:aminopeptidase N/puromycin-sensitive aminopeptidase
MKIFGFASHLFQSPCAALVAPAGFLCLFLASARPAQAQRLPQSVRPEHYTLTLTPDLKAATFSGVESIDVNLAEPTNRITLNAAEIDFEGVSVTAGGKQQSASVSLDKEKEQASFTFPENLPAGKATLTIRYRGILNNELRGFYLSKTALRNYAVSQFESTDARRAFPCFDEPAFKATFDVSLVADTGDTAISNGPIIADTPGDKSGVGSGKHTLSFATTPKMSTYLVAFLVGDFQCSAGESDGVAIRVCSTPDRVAFTRYGVDVAQEVLHYYNNYFGIPYPLKKLDLIALPDFEAGAMENFGAITYRETDLLLDSKTASINAKKEVALVIAHEMAHQWFGDLVTMQWWDNLWLNEGFATWMESKAVARMHPEWNIDQEVIADVNKALNLDSYPTTRAIRARADTPDEINQMFDGIAYDKAGAVLLAVENYLGEETFRRGVHNYLAAHLYANATAEDFWNAQTAASLKPVDRIMESLVTLPGVPLLSFGEPAARSVAVSQQRFFLSSRIKKNSKQKWTLPICFVAAKGQDCQLLTPSSATLPAPETGVFFAKTGGKGYFRSTYTPRDYATLVASVEIGLTPAERISLIGDEWAQVNSGKAPIGAYLDLVTAVKADSSAEVVQAAMDGVNIASSNIPANSQQRTALAAWIYKTFAPEYAKLGPPASSDSANTRQLRAELFTILGEYGRNPATLAQAREISALYLADPGSVDATFGQAAVAIAVHNGDAALFDRLQRVYETSANPELQEDALRLLAQFENPALIQRSLDYAVSGKVRNQDVAIQFTTAMGSSASREQTWKYIQNHWEKVQAQLTTEMGGKLVKSTSHFCSAEARDDVEKFFEGHQVAASDKSLVYATERIDGCIELHRLQGPNLKQWLAAQPKP